MTDGPISYPISWTEDINSPLSFGRSGDNPPYVYAFQFKCRNTSAEPIVISAASVISMIGGQSIDMKVPDKPIPPDGEFVMIGVISAVEGSAMENGLFFDDFRKQFEGFNIGVHVEGLPERMNWFFLMDAIEAMLAAGEKAVARK